MDRNVKIPQRWFGGAVLSASLSWLSGCAEIRTFEQMRPSDVVGTSSDLSCVVITKGQPLHQVKACDHGNRLEIVAPAWVHSYKKADIHRAVTDLYMQFVTNPKLAPHGLTGAGADVWADVALTDPNDVRFVILFRTKDGVVLVREPLDIRRWEMIPESLVFIPEFNYPSPKARKMGVVQIVPHHDVTMAQMTRFFALVAAKSSVPTFRVEGTWPYLILKTRPFTEVALVKGLSQQTQAKDLINDVIFIPVGEREGAKYKLMSMDIVAPVHGVR